MADIAAIAILFAAGTCFFPSYPSQVICTYSQNKQGVPDETIKTGRYRITQSRLCLHPEPIFHPGAVGQQGG